MNIDEAIEQAEQELLLQPTYNVIKERLALLRFVRAWDALQAAPKFHDPMTVARSDVFAARAAIDEALK